MIAGAAPGRAARRRAGPGRRRRRGGLGSPRPTRRGRAPDPAACRSLRDARPPGASIIGRAGLPPRPPAPAGGGTARAARPPAPGLRPAAASPAPRLRTAGRRPVPQALGANGIRQGNPPAVGPQGSVGPQRAAPGAAPALLHPARHPQGMICAPGAVRMPASQRSGTAAPRERPGPAPGGLRDNRARGTRRRRGRVGPAGRTKPATRPAGGAPSAPPRARGPRGGPDRSGRRGDGRPQRGGNGPPRAGGKGVAPHRREAPAGPRRPGGTARGLWIGRKPGPLRCARGIALVPRDCWRVIGLPARRARHAADRPDRARPPPLGARPCGPGAYYRLNSGSDKGLSLGRFHRRLPAFG